MEACSAGVARAATLGRYALTAYPTERTKSAKESGNSSTCLALAGSAVEANPEANPEANLLRA